MDKTISANKPSSVKTSEGRQKKADTVAVLEAKVSKAKAMIMTDYRGIKHKDMEAIRKVLKKANAELVVSKNKLMLRALGNKADSVASSFTESTAVLFEYGDEVAPLKELLKFFKITTIGKAKGGLLGDRVLTEAEVNRLATLPSRDLLLAKLVGQLNAPIQGLHYALSWNLNKFVWALNAVKIKKGSINSLPSFA